MARVGDNVVARTALGRRRRLLLGGHLDTVPANGNDSARLDGDTLGGLGAADMKGGLAVMTALAVSHSEPAVDVTYVFYVCEEVDRRFSGLLQIWESDPELLSCDSAVLGEPTSSRVEAGCQGTLRLAITLGGQRAHTARPWRGSNAIHRVGPLLERMASWEGRRPVIDGCQFREALQVVGIEGGVANNVVPDRVTLAVNHRFAPDRTAEEAMAHLHSEVLSPDVGSHDQDKVQVEDAQPAAPPRLDDPLLSALVSRVGAPPTGKLGWTDVAFFAERGIPAANFGPGDPEVSHTAEERVEALDLEAAYEALSSVISDAGR